MSTATIEKRVTPRKVELRAAPEGSSSPGTLVGYAAVYNTMSEDLGGWYETIAPGAFDGVMGDNCCCLRNHEDDKLLGRTVSGTLRIESDSVGLRFECDLPNTSVGHDTAELVSRGDMPGCSFQYRVAPEGDSWDWSKPMPVRTVRKYSRLYDVGPVTFPAYPDTSVEVRTLEGARQAFEAAEAARRCQDLARARLRVAESTIL